MGLTHFKLALVSVLILGFHLIGLGSESPGCSFEGLHLDKCLSQGGQYIFLEPCCGAMNRAIRAGFHCLCSMLATNAPQFTSLFSLSLTSCYIAIPPLTMCRDFATMPIALPVPPDSPPEEQQLQPSGKEKQILPSSPLLPRSDSKGNTTVSAMENRPPPGENATQMLHVIENRNTVHSSGELTNLLWGQSWFISLTVYSLVLSV